jgi:hypothetical protein
MAFKNEADRSAFPALISSRQASMILTVFETNDFVTYTINSVPLSVRATDLALADVAAWGAGQLPALPRRRRVSGADPDRSGYPPAFNLNPAVGANCRI